MSLYDEMAAERDRIEDELLEAQRTVSRLEAERAAVHAAITRVIGIPAAYPLAATLEPVRQATAAAVRATFRGMEGM